MSRARGRRGRLGRPAELPRGPRRSYDVAVRSTIRLVLTAALAAAAFALPSPAGADACRIPPLTYRHGTVTFTERGVTTGIRVEVADTEELREFGLMCRRSLDPDAGMLFVFGGSTRAPFWMKNTLIPLSIAFFDDSALPEGPHLLVPRGWRIVGFRDMRVAPDPANPPPADLWAPDHSYRYALEVNQGFFTEHRIDEGAQVRFTPDKPSKP